MQIEVESLSGAGEPFAHTYAPGELELEDERARLAGEAVVAGRASRKGEEVRLRGTLSAAVEAPCDRCLRHVALPLESEFDVTYVPRGAEAAKGEETELGEEDLLASVYEGGHVDVDELVREQVLLALPTRLRCGDDCKGLCPSCGADLNVEACGCEQQQVDPRWAALADLKRE